MSDARHILLVEDEPTLQRILGSVLTDAGHRVESVGTAEAALSRLRDSSADEVDLVLADKNLPAMSGLELLQLLRRDEQDHALLRAFILVTGYPSRESALTVLGEGGDGYMIKPFRSLVHAVEEVQGVLRAPLEQRRRAALTARRLGDALRGLPTVFAPGLRVALLLDDEEAAKRASACLERVGVTLADVDSLGAEGPRGLLAGRVEDLETFAKEHPDVALVLADPGASFPDVVALIRAGGGAVFDPALVPA